MMRYSTTGSPDLAIYFKLAGTFKTGVVPSEAKLYPELKMSALCIEAATFVRRTGCTSAYTAKKAYQELSTVERGLYPQVLRLSKVLSVCRPQHVNGLSLV